MNKKLIIIIPIIVIIVLFFVFRKDKKTDNYFCKDIAVNSSEISVDYSEFWPVVSEIVEKMSLDQKVGQMTLVDLVSLIDPVTGKIDFDLLKVYQAGGVYVGANDVPDGHGGLVEKGESCGYDAKALLSSTLDEWQDYASRSNIPTVVDLGGGESAQIPPLIGMDTPHGNMHVLGAVLFPQNIGLAATFDPELFCASGFFTAESVLESGFNWGFSPTVAVSHNPKWGRFYESMGMVPVDIEKYAKSYVAGMQAADPEKGHLSGILSTAKHYLGDGATFNGIDEGNVRVEETKEAQDNFLNTNIAGYKGAIDAGSGSIMVSYSAVNDIWMSINSNYLSKLFDGSATGIHKGFLVSDQQAINKIATQGLPTVPAKLPYDEAISRGIMSGLDMIMTFTLYTVYRDIPAFMNILRKNIADGRISIERIDDAVKRILAVKYAMGLIRKVDGKWISNKRPPLPGFDQIYPVPGASSVRDAARKTALAAAEKSLVLLKNAGNTLPLNLKKLKYIIVTGERIISTRISKEEKRDVVYQNYNNIGTQSGSWTITWQGFEGNTFWTGENKISAGGATVLDGIEELLKTNDSNAKILYPIYNDTSDIPSVRGARAEFISRLSSIKDMNEENTVIITALAESPYTEFMGDIDNPYCVNSSADFTNGCLYNLHFNWYLPDQQSRTLEKNFDEFDMEVINRVKKISGIDTEVVTILFSGRPLIVKDAIEKSDAFIAAFLPGPTGGKAIANALAGNYLFCGGDEVNSVCRDKTPNRLPVDWTGDMESVRDFPVYTSNVKGIPRIKNPLFTVGYGLPTKKKNN